MSTWYYRINGEEHGPVSASQLKQLAESGEVRPEHEVRRSDGDVWKAASRIKGLFAEELPTSRASAGTPAPEAPAEAVMPAGETATFGDRVKRAAKHAATLAAKQAALTTLKATELPKADLATGTKAHELSVGRAEFSDLYDAVRQCEEEAQAKRAAEPVSQHETIADRGKRLARDAKKKFEVEKCLQARKKKLIELGRLFRENPAVDGAGVLKAEIQQARAAAAKVAALEAEVAQLSEAGPAFVTKRRLTMAAAGCFVLIPGMWFSGVFRSATPEEQAAASMVSMQESLASIASEAEAEKNRIQAEIARTEQELQKEALESTKREELQEVRRNLEVRQKQLAAEQRAKERDLAARRAEEEQKAASAVMLAKAQVDRKALADKLFGQIVLDPASTVQLSRSLQKPGVSVQLRGKGFPEISQLHKARDWVGLVNYLEESQYTELPDSRQIERAASKLQDYPFVMLLTTDEEYQHGYDRPVLHLFSFPLRVTGYGSQVINASGDWKRHPDGIGYTHGWSPADGNSVIVAMTWHTADNKVRQFNRTVTDRADSLRRKVELGEVSEEAFSLEVAATVQQVFDKAVAWAKSQ